MPYPHRLLLDILPQNTPNSQNLLLRCPPTDFTDLHRYLWCAVLPQNSQNSQNLAAWVWQECHTLLHLCSSVPSVGGSSLSEVSVRSVLICGRLFSVRSFRALRAHLWESFLCKSFCAFRAFCGNIFSPTDFTDLHRYLGCAVLPQNLATWVWQECHTLLHL